MCLCVFVLNDFIHLHTHIIYIIYKIYVYSLSVQMCDADNGLTMLCRCIEGMALTRCGGSFHQLEIVVFGSSGSQEG